MKNLQEMHAREKAGMPPDWELYRWDCHRKHGVLYYFALSGAVAPPKLGGKNKGRRNWAKMDKDTERTVIITPAEHEAWVDAWSEKTGLCPECIGEGRVVHSASVRDGVAYRPCGDCEGTGKAKAVAVIGATP